MNVRRRDFITLLGGAAAAWPLAARGQESKTRVIGFLGAESPRDWTDRLLAFRQGLSETGNVEGRNVTIDYRWAENNNDRLPSLAADLVRRSVSVIAAPGSTLAALAAKAATTSIPIVFWVGGDPVTAGLVASLNRPGGNITGVAALNVELAPKRLELLHELVPKATAIAVLINPLSPLAEPQVRALQAAAQTLGLGLHILRASNERDLENSFIELQELRAGALLITADVFFSSRNAQLAALTLRYAVPTVAQFREFAVAGGLMSYGGSISDALRLAGNYTGRILNGEKPADLPVQQLTRVELALNQNAARALGITFPITLLGRADEVIE